MPGGAPELIAPPRSGLRMRTLRGGARHYVEKTIKTHEGSDPGADSLPPNNTHFLSVTSELSSIPQILPFSARHHLRRPPENAGAGEQNP